MSGMNERVFVIPEGTTVIGTDTLPEWKESMTGVEIPDSVTQIGDSAFQNCSSLTGVVIPESVIQISRSAFAGCNSLVSLCVAENHPCYTGEGTMLLSKDGTKLIACMGEPNAVVTPEGVKEIGEHAFDGCISLKSVVISEGVEEIGDYAFYDCDSLTKVEMPDSVTWIGNFAFWYCDSLQEVRLPRRVFSGHHVFGDFDQLFLL